MRKKYIPKTKEKINKDNYKELLKIEKNGEYEWKEEYVKSTEPILCKHLKCGHEWKVAPYEIIKRGCNCPKCAFKKDDKKSSIEELKKVLQENYGYQPYTFIDDYIDIKTPIEVKCNTCNHIFKVSPKNIKNNIRLNRKPVCKFCNKVRLKEDNLVSYQRKLDKLFGKDNSYIVSNYINQKTKATHKCKVCNKTFDAAPENVLYRKIKFKKRYCPYCNKLARDDRSYEEKLKECNETIIPLEKFINRKTKIMHQCLKCGYKWKSIPNNLLRKEGCPKCSNKITQSNGEKEIIDFLKSIYKGKIIQKDRTILNGKELDVYVPDKHFAIEFDGFYWHSDKYKEKDYHLNKTVKCLDKGIQLIHIFDFEWENKQDLIKDKLIYLLGLSNKKRIYARKCSVKEINSKEKNEFLILNHIQGKDAAKIKLGLFYEDNLVSVMTFCKPRKSLGQKDSKFDYELSRFASDNNFIVIGGFGKILKYFERNYDWNRIITYADRRFSTGNLYFKNNFKFLHYSKPNYYYVNVNTKKVYHRYSFRKQVLQKKFPNLYSDNKTEFQIMDETKLYKRIYDCGNYVFYYKRRE